MSESSNPANIKNLTNQTAEETKRLIQGEKPDPTGNVLQLVDAAVKRNDDILTAAIKRMDDLRAAETRRTDDLREAEMRYNRLSAEFTERVATIRENQQRELNVKESSRLDSVRQVDREDGKNTAVQAQQAITTLANSTIVLKDTLQAQVAATALAVENRQAIFASEVNKRISQLELQYSEGKGKSEIRDPALDDLVKIVSQLANQRSEKTGQKDMVGWIVAGVLFLIALVSFWDKLNK